MSTISLRVNPVSYTHLGKDLHSTETLASHADWALKFMSKYDKIDESNIGDIINEEIGLVFKEVLECAGVYKLSLIHIYNSRLSWGLQYTS